MWSVGCILAEMLSGKPLFPGRDYHHQLTLILDVLGTPTLDEFYAITTRRSRDYIRALPFRRKRPFAQLFPNASPLAVDFLTKTLTFDPKKRLTVEQALCHPYLEAYHDPDDEPAYIDAFGTLAVRDDGAATFYGRSAGSEVRPIDLHGCLPGTERICALAEPPSGEHLFAFSWT